MYTYIIKQDNEIYFYLLTQKKLYIFGFNTIAAGLLENGSNLKCA